MKVSHNSIPILSEYCKLHLKLLPDDIFSLLGSQTCLDYYRILFKKNDLVRAYEIQEGKKTKGFVVYTLFNTFSQVHFFLNWGTLVKIIQLFFTKPLFMLNLIMYILDPLKPKMKTELAYIMVDYTKGKGHGSYLLQDSLKRRDFELPIFVKTLNTTKNNILFYQKNGFKKIYNRFQRVILIYEG